jgi:urease accessory protein
MKRRIPRVGVGGPVGCGKTSLIEAIVPRLVSQGYKVGIVTNDIITKEDAERIRRRLGTIIPDDLIVGVETGGCPHTAVREDPSMNINVVEQMESKHPELDIVILESAGDNLTLTFSSALVDYFIFIVDVTGGDKVIRKDGLGITKSDLLLINKIDLAPYVATTLAESDTPYANLELMRKDAERLRPGKPFLFIDCKSNSGIDQVLGHIKQDVLFEEA